MYTRADYEFIHLLLYTRRISIQLAESSVSMKRYGLPSPKRQDTCFLSDLHFVRYHLIQNTLQTKCTFKLHTVLLENLQSLTVK